MKRSVAFRGIFGVLIVVFGVQMAWADGPTSSDVSAEQQKAEFDRQFVNYKAALQKIEHLHADFQAADAATRDSLNQQLRDATAAAKKQLDAVVAAGLAVYRSAPNADRQISDLLVAVARFYAEGEEVRSSPGTVNGGDNYEQALPIIKTLVDAGAQEKQLPVWGILAAFATNDYDSTATYLERAKKSGAFIDPRSITDPAEQAVMAHALEFALAIDEYRDLWAKEQEIRAAEAKADDLPRVKLTTTKGDITLELFENEAPQAVANFITLVKKGFYNGLAFHRVIHCFMAQGGDPNGNGSGGPGYAIRCECYQPNVRHHFRGSLSMAHAGRDTGGSQFFLTFVPAPHLDGKHTVFGRVIDGMEVLGDLQKREPNGDPQHDAALAVPDRIIKAEVSRDRGHEYTFDKLPAR